MIPGEPAAQEKAVVWAIAARLATPASQAVAAGGYAKCVWTHEAGDMRVLQYTHAAVTAEEDAEDASVVSYNAVKTVSESLVSHSFVIHHLVQATKEGEVLVAAPAEGQRPN